MQRDLNFVSPGTSIVVVGDISGNGELGEQCLFSASSNILAYIKECFGNCSSTVWFRLMQVGFKLLSVVIHSLQ